MTSRKLQHRDVTGKERLTTRIWNFSKKHLLPSLVEDISDLRKRKAAGENIGKHPYWKATGKYAARVAASAGVYGGLNYLYGVRSWDVKGDLGAERMIKDSGPVAAWVTTKVSAMLALSSMDPEKLTTMASTLMAVEVLSCVLRGFPEHIARRKNKITGEPAGTLFSPMTIVPIELAYKAKEIYPTDPIKLTAIAIRGMWGNFIRMVHSGLIIAFGNQLWNKVNPKPPTDQSPDPTRNKYGYPIVRKDDNWEDGA